MASDFAKDNGDPGGVGEHLLGSMLRAARLRNELSQQDVASDLKLSPPAISNFESGQRLPSIAQLVGLSKVLSLNSLHLALAWTYEQIQASVSADAPQETNEVVANLAAEYRGHFAEVTRPIKTAIQGPALTLNDWPHGFDVRTVLVGDRREVPPHTFADILALPASTGDLTYFGDLGLKNVRIRSDKIVKLADSAALRKKLDHDILVIGSPAANLAARLVNHNSFFRFLVDPGARQRESRIERDLTPIAYDSDALDAYIASSPEHSRAIRFLLYEFARPGFIDPVEPFGPRGIAKSARVDFGTVSVCRHPWSDSHVAILAAGIGGPGTAASLKLLATSGAFEERPFGGIFRVRIATEAHWEDRYDMLKPIWDTHPYTVDTFKREITGLATSNGEGLSQDDVKGLATLVDILEKRAS